MEADLGSESLVEAIFFPDAGLRWGTSSLDRRLGGKEKKESSLTVGEFFSLSAITPAKTRSDTGKSTNHGGFCESG